MILCDGGCGRKVSDEPDLDRSSGLYLSCGREECNRNIEDRIGKRLAICMQCGLRKGDGPRCCKCGGGEKVLYLDRPECRYLDGSLG